MQMIGIINGDYSYTNTIVYSVINVKGEKEMAKKHLTDPASEARRVYQREHYARNKEQYREKAQRYWERKAEEAKGNDADRK